MIDKFAIKRMCVDHHKHIMYCWLQDAFIQFMLMLYNYIL